MATLKVNLSKVGHACDVDETPAGIFPQNGWYLYLQKCDGTSFSRGGKYYENIPVDHGYAEIPNVPEGLYILFAIVNPFPTTVQTPFADIIYQSNMVSHFAMIDVCCGCKDVCVTLYNSGWHYCVYVIIHWFQFLVEQKQMNVNIAENAINAMQEAIKTTGKTQPTDSNIIKQLAKITEEFTEENKKD
jgi:hypothetical protein